jgi:virginiamycin B lyase
MSAIPIFAPIRIRLSLFFSISILSLLLVTSQPTSAVSIQEFQVPTAAASPRSITAGPDGNLWFTEECGNKIGKIDPDGQIKEYAREEGVNCTICKFNCLGSGQDWYVLGKGLHGITTGADGSLWYADSGNNKIGKMSKDGVILGEYQVDACPEFSQTRLGPHGITSGPYNTIWFSHSACNYIGVIAVNTGEMIWKYILPENGSSAHITVDPDGNIWYTEHGSTEHPVDKVGMINASDPRCHRLQKYEDPASPCIHEYPIPTNSAMAFEITAVPDGNLWFTERGGNKLGKINFTPGAPDTVDIAEYPLPDDTTRLNDPIGIAAGPDSKIWFTEYTNIAFITNGGNISKFPIPSGNRAWHITAGPDGNFWFTELHGNKIGKVRIRIAYVYDSASPGTHNFKDFLAGKGYRVDPVTLSQAENFNFSPDQAIIIDADTGHGGGEGKGWVWSGTSAAVNNIKNAGKPVIGIWLGGAAFFSEVGGLGIDYGHSWTHHDNWGKVVVVNASDSIWSSPKSIPNGGNESSFEIYNSGTAAYIAADLPTAVPGVIPIARQLGDSSHYPVLTQTVSSRTYALWGYADPNMTPDGEILFTNLLDKIE